MLKNHNVCVEKKNFFFDSQRKSIHSKMKSKSEMPFNIQVLFFFGFLREIDWHQFKQGTQFKIR